MQRERAEIRPRFPVAGIAALIELLPARDDEGVSIPAGTLENFYITTKATPLRSGEKSGLAQQSWFATCEAQA